MTPSLSSSVPPPKLRLIFEMETSDPDDFLTLLWLADHPRVDLCAVVVTPGGGDQCQLVRWGLNRCGRTDVVIGALHGMPWWKTAEAAKQRVSQWHYKVFGDEILDTAIRDVEPGPDLVAALLSTQHGYDITYLVGSAPKNIGQAFRAFGSKLRLQRWVQQGFFAGDNLVPEADRLAKFKGKTTCPSFNPGGDPKSSLELLASDRIIRKIAVSKNVCHGVRWTQRLRAEWLVRAAATPMTINMLQQPAKPEMIRLGLRMMLQGFDAYLTKGAAPDPNIPWEMESEKAGQGKAMHDLVAAAVCLDESVVDLVPAEIYRERGEWGARGGTHARASTDPNTALISVGFHEDRFLRVLAE